ncbi:MAG: KH domain-containing protein [Parasporobacterium sp.]|nr:KH domain-containing protein [Parasporobacterium sp.]
MKEYKNEAVNTVLNEIFAKLGVEAEISMQIDEAERVINVDVTGENTGELIGKKGQTLDAVQYLISIIINNRQESYYRVKLDTNNYRERRQKTLENLAKNMAGKVKKTRKKAALEPMNPYERRVIHSYLQSDKFVTTKSEGEEPNRRVVIYYKKG